jgi:hypothetical protein
MVLIKLLVAHILGDFLLQTDKWVSHKNQNKIKSIYLYIHSFFIGLLSYLFLAEWTRFLAPIIIFITHLLIDVWKITRKQTRLNFLLDQLFHIAVIIVIWRCFYSSDIDTIIAFILQQEFNKLWLIIFGYSVLIWPVGYIIGAITKKWQKEIDNDGLDKAGMWIGQLERILILTFILISQIEALGFLIAAKSILRVSVKKKEERKLTEYVLIGTMLSFSTAIFIGIFIKYLKNLI